MKKLGIAKHTKIMDRTEIVNFLKNKNIYKFECSWITQYRQLPYKQNFYENLPYNCFTLNKNVKLVLKTKAIKKIGYGFDTYKSVTVNNKSLFDYLRYSITVSKKVTKNNKIIIKWYVTKIFNR